MAETVQSMEGLAALKAPEPEAAPRVQKLDIASLNRKNTRSA